jgi:hypothetical protein
MVQFSPLGPGHCQFLMGILSHAHDWFRHPLELHAQ